MLSGLSELTIFSMILFLMLLIIISFGCVVLLATSIRSLVSNTAVTKMWNKITKLWN